ncbi:MAG: hypothetical protein BRC29_01190 [Nanohaloarchaea archaeon SW_7_43_1]|nr:MAG: hypothetical protein BRC29_01190 [Nanohaloarchaea archaeon SW_7_43_1]
MSSTVNSTVFKIFLPVLIGLAIFATLDSIKVNSLDPSVNSLEAALNSMDRSVTFGDIEDEQKGRQEIREAIFYNIIIAQKCNLLKAVYDADWERLQTSDKASWGGIAPDPDKDVVFFYNGDQISEGFEVSKSEELSISCVGADSPTEMIRPNAEDLREGAGTSKTNDMEGKFGRVSFDMNDTVVIEDPKIGSTSLFEGNPWRPSGNFPDFWRNQRLSMMLPNGLEETNDLCDNVGPEHYKKTQSVFYKEYEAISGLYEAFTGNNEDINVYEGREGPSSIYAFRVRMQNVPIIKEGYLGPKQNLNTCQRGTESKLKKFLIGGENQDSARYVLCKSASGYIQSNAGSIDNTGETNVDRIDLKRDFATETIFPKLLIRENSDYCLSDTQSEFIDYRLNGDKCTTEEVLKDREGSEPVTKNWRGLEVKCGIKKETITQENGGGFNFYNTGWFKTGGKLNGDIKAAGSLYETENGNDGGVESADQNTEGNLIIRSNDQQGSKVTFKTAPFSVENVGLSFETKGDMNVNLKQDEDKQIQFRIEMDRNNENKQSGVDYTFDIIENGDTKKSFTDTIDAEQQENAFDVVVDLQYRENLELTVKGGDEEKDIFDETIEVSEINVNYIEFETSVGDTVPTTKVKEVSIKE